ncbi:MAG: HAD hydrolase-like protein [Candidatus Moraniibacteriota bacterium]
MFKILQNKRIIFFDGDGTLWYPKSTKHRVAPHWIYKDLKIGQKFLDHLVIIPSVLKTLKELKHRDFIMIIISTHPHRPKIAHALLKEKISYFNLEGYFEEFYASRDYPEGKGEVIARVLKKKKIPKSHALMIGDSYAYDYLSAKKVGVDSILIKSEYLKPEGKRVKKVISQLSDILDVLPKSR